VGCSSVVVVVVILYIKRSRDFSDVIVEFQFGFGVVKGGMTEAAVGGAVGITATKPHRESQSTFEEVFVRV